MSDIVIRVENLYKEYKLGVINHGTLSHDLQSWWARLRGKDDPNSLISEQHNIDAETNSFLALKDINFEVQAGDRLGIIGKNGAGKSTLLKILSRITSPTRGNVKIKGRVGSLLEVGTGFHPELTGRENIYLNGAILGMGKREIDRKLDEIVDFAGIEKHLDTPVKRYSSGMNVRLGFAVAAHLEPEILIVDEVLAVGDAEFQKKAIGKMEDVSKGEGRTILFVSHNMGAINRLCNNGIVLNNGELVFKGNVREAIQYYLSANTYDKKKYIQPHMPDKKVNLRSVYLNNHKNEILYDEPFLICVEYEVNKPVSNCTVWLALETMDGTMVFTTADYDSNRHLLGDRTPGNFLAKVMIPGAWLNVGEYIVIIGIVENNPLVIYDRAETITIKVEEVETPGSVLMAGARRGVLQPILEWKNEKI